MSVSSYHRVTSGECTICHGRDNLAAHEGGGELHPTCIKCIKMGGFIASSCLTCTTSVNSGTLFTLKERVVKELAYVACDAAAGVAWGLYDEYKRSEESEECVKSNMFYTTVIAVGFGLWRRHFAGSEIQENYRIRTEEPNHF